jgi:hypothetical protein
VKSYELQENELFVVDWLARKAREVGLRVVRAIVVSTVAFWLAGAQGYFIYPKWGVWLIVVVFATLNRFYWVAGLVVGWLVVLYLLPPELVGAVAKLLGGMS